MARLVRTLTAAGAVFLLAGAAQAAESPRESRPTLALVSVTGGASFPERERASIEEVLLSALEQTGKFRVIGRSDLQAMIGVEAQRQALGCEANTECMVNIAGALGAQFVCAANVGRVGTVTVLTFKVIDARRASALIHARKTVKADAELIPAADEIAKEVVEAVAAQEAVHAKPISVGRAVGIGAMVVGVAGLVAATVLAIGVASDTKSLQTMPPSHTVPIQTEINTVNSHALDANILFGVGGALAAAGVGLAVAF